MRTDADLKTQEYLLKVTPRLQRGGFKITYNVKYDRLNLSFLCVAKQTEFQVEKFGFNLTCFVFARLGSVNANSLRDFSARSFKYVKRTNWLHPPRSLFYSMDCLPVAIVDSINNETAQAVSEEVPAIHWAACEMPVVCSLEQRSIYFSKTNHRWGSLYYPQVRALIEEILTP